MIEKLFELIKEDEKASWFTGYNYEQSIDYLFELMDGPVFEPDNLEKINQTNFYLKELTEHIEKLSSSLIVGILSITNPNCIYEHINEKLTNRKEFVVKAREHLTKIVPDRVERLMKGFE